MDRDFVIYEKAQAALTSVDRKYRKANFNEQLKLKKDRDKLFNAYRKARLKLIDVPGTISTPKDLEKMKELRSEIANAKKTQTIVVGIAKLVKFLAKYAV